MGTFFDLENPFWRFISKGFDAVLLSLLWIILCIPIITIGASTTSFYYTLMKISKGEEGYILRDFFNSFRSNFKQSTIAWVIILIIGLIFLWDIYFYRMSTSLLGNIAYYIFLFLSLLLFLVSLYLFPLIAKFKNTTKNLFKFAFIMCIKHLGWSALMLTFIIIAFNLTLYIPPLILVLPGILSLTNATIFNHIFDIYIKKMEENREKEEAEKSQDSLDNE